MANKTIAIKVDLQGTEAQQKKLVKLEKNLVTLTKQRTRLNNQLKKGVITRDQFSKAVAKNNLNLKAHRAELLKTRQQMLGIDGFTKKLGKSFARLGTTISGAFAGMFAVSKFFQIVSDGIKTVQEFEQQMANVKAISGATAMEFKLLIKQAKELGSTTVFTATQVGQLQEELSKLGFSTSEILASSEAILQLAQATGSDLAEASVVAGATLRGFGLEASDMQEVVDVMAKSFTSSALDMEKFKESMKSVAPIAKTTETSLQDASAALSILADRGVSGSLAGTQLRKIMADLATKTGVSFQESLKITQDRLAQATSSSEKLAIAKELVGDRAKGSLIALAENREELIGLSVEYQNAAGTAEEMADIMADTSEGASKRFSSAWEGMLLDIDDGNADALKNVKNWAADMLNTFAKVNKDLNRLRSVGAGSGINFFGGTSVEQQEFLKILDRNEQFLKDNIDNREAINKETIKVSKQLLSLTDKIKKARDEGNDDLADSLDTVAQIQIKHFNNLKQIREDFVKDDKVRKHQELIDAEETTEALTEAEKKKLDKIAKERKKNEEKLNRIILKMQQSQSVAEIEDKRKAEFKKLEIAKDNALAEVELIKATGDKKNKARLAIENNFNAQEKALKAKHAAEDKKAQDKIKEKQDAKDKKALEKKEADEKAFKEQVREESLNLAEQSANALIDVANRKVEREKTLELAALDARLQQGLISQADFEKEREAIERKAFQRQKRLEIAQIAISLAREIASIAANSAGNPLNAFTFGSAGAAQNIALAGIATARSAVQAGIVASQRFAEGGYTGSGFGSPDSSGFKQAGVVHEGEYVVPKNVLESQRGASLVGALEAMRTSRPQPFSNIGFANGGFAGASGVDISDLENKISRAVASSIGSIQVVNNATDTITQAAKVNNIQSEATFG